MTDGNNCQQDFVNANMTRVIRTLLFLSLILAACSPNGPSPQPALLTTAPSTQSVATLSTPHIEQGPNGESTLVSNPQECAYQWAYKDLPELSADFLNSIHELQPDAQATAFGFGETCTRADGTSSFIPMETDFNLTLQVSDLSNEADLGEWVMKIMQVIDAIPADQIMGPKPGRVIVMFEANGDRAGVSFYIDQYHALPSDLSNEQIYQTLKNSQ